MDTAAVESAYACIADTTPLKSDCGLLCGAACCRPDEDGQGGVALLPEEEHLLRGCSFGTIERDEYMDAPMLICTSPCDRTLRPFLCRIFPLCPVMGKDGKWTVRMDARARAVCPLLPGGIRALDPDFVKDCVKAVRLLANDKDGLLFITKWSEREKAFREVFL